MAELSKIRKVRVSRKLVFRDIEHRRESLQEFLNWIDKVDIKHEGVKIVFIEKLNGFGLEASGKLCLGSDILQVPRKAIFSWDLARKSAFLRFFSLSFSVLT